MLQESTSAAAGGNNAAALQQMSFGHMIQNFDTVAWIVFITLVIMSAMSVYWMIFNFVRNMRLRATSDRIINTFWETPNAQDAIRYMEEQPRSEPFCSMASTRARRSRALAHSPFSSAVPPISSSRV